MSEPIAVAFVEVRPDTSEFRTNAERELSAGLDREVEVRGRVELDGVTNARREIDSLRSGLENIGTGQQLQFAGLDEATRDASLLKEQLQEVSGVDVSKPVTQFQQSLATLAPTSAFATIGADAHGAAEGLSEVGHAAEEAAGGVGHTDAAVLEANAALVEAGVSGQKFGGTMKEAGRVAATGMSAAAAATREEAAATRAATVEEERFIKVRSRRSTAVGAFRFAGVGLLAGSAIFGATRALGELTSSLQVTGNEALTTEGRLRNLAANVIGGDFVGAVKSLINQTRTYNHEQLEMIAGSFELEQALRAMGRGGDIARSRISELGHVLEEAQPQFLATQLAEARASGDEGAVVEVLKRQGLRIEEALEEAGHLRGNVKALNREIKTRRDELEQVRAEIAKLADAPTVGGRLVNQRGQVRFNPLGQLREREEQLVDQMNEFAKQRNETVPAFNLTKEAIADATRANKEAVDAAIRSTAEQTLQPLREAVIDATLADDPEAIIRALANEASRLRGLIAAYEGSAEDRERFKNDLIAVNRAKESTQEAIVAEAERHRQAMIDNRLAPSEEAIIDAELRDASTIPARQARIAQIESILATGIIGGKKLSRDQRIALKNEMEAQNNAIKAEQEQINANEQRRIDENKRQLDELDNAFLRDSALRQASLRRRQAAAEESPGVVDDIRVSNDIQLFYKNEIARARATIKDAATLKETISQLRDSQLDEFLNERALRREQRRTALERREEGLDINIELAQINENRNAEIRARNARIAFLRERIESTRRGSLERRRLRLEIARERAAIRELKGEVDNDGAEFKQMAFQFLTELRGFSSNLAGNVLTPGFTLTQPGTSSSATPPPRPRKPILEPTGLAVTSPFERPDQTAAAGLRAAEGQPATAGQLSTLISQTGTTNRLLGDIKRGIGHPEAKTSKDLARHRGSTTGVS